MTAVPPNAITVLDEQYLLVDVDGGTQGAPRPR